MNSNSGKNCAILGVSHYSSVLSNPEPYERVADELAGHPVGEYPYPRAVSQVVGSADNTPRVIEAPSPVMSSSSFGVRYASSASSVAAPRALTAVEVNEIMFGGNLPKKGDKIPVPKKIKL